MKKSFFNHVLLLATLLVLAGASLFAQSPSVTYTNPPRDAQNIPLRQQITVMFDQPVNLGRITNETPNNMEDCDTIPAFLVIKSSNLAEAKSTKKWFNYAVKGLYHNSAQEIVFYPEDQAVDYETNYTILITHLAFGSDAAPTYLESYESKFQTVARPHYIMSTNISPTGYMSCGEPISLVYNRVVNLEQIHGTEFVQLLEVNYAMPNEVGVGNTTRQIETRMTLSADKKTVYIAPARELDPQKDYRLIVNNGALTGNANDVTLYELKVKSVIAMDLSVKLTAKDPDYESPDNIDYFVGSGRQIIHNGEQINLKAPLVSGDYFFKNWECPEVAQINGSTDTVLSLPYDCKLPNEIVVKAVYSPLPYDYVILPCDPKFYQIPESKGSITKLDEKTYKVKRSIANTILITAYNERREMSFTEWSGFNFDDPRDKKDPAIVIPVQRLWKDYANLRDMLLKGVQKFKLPCPGFQLLDGCKEYKLNVSIQPFEYWPAALPSFPNPSDYREVMSIYVNGDLITPNMSWDGKNAKGTKIEVQDGFSVEAYLNPPFDEDWEIDYIWTDDQDMSRRYFPSNYDHKTRIIPTNTLPWLQNITCFPRCERNLKFFLRRKTHTLDIEVTSITNRVLKPEWTMTYTTPSPYIRYTPTNWREDLPQTNTKVRKYHLRYRHGDLVTVKPNKIEFNSEWITPDGTYTLGESIDQTTHEMKLTMLDDYKTCYRYGVSTFHLMLVEIQEEDTLTGGRIYKQYTPNDPALREELKVVYEGGNAQVKLIFDKDVDLSSARTNINAYDIAGIRPQTTNLAAGYSRFDCNAFQTYLSNRTQQISLGTNPKEIVLTITGSAFGNKIQIDLAGVTSVDGSNLEGDQTTWCRIFGPRLKYSYNKVELHHDYEPWYKNSTNELYIPMNGMSFSDPYKQPMEKFEGFKHPSWALFDQIDPDAGGIHDYNPPQTIYFFTKRVQKISHTVNLNMVAGENNDDGDTRSVINAARTFLSTQLSKYADNIVPGLGTVATAVVNLIVNKIFSTDDVAIAGKSLYFTQPGDSYQNTMGCWGVGPCNNNGNPNVNRIHIGGQVYITLIVSYE